MVPCGIAQVTMSSVEREMGDAAGDSRGLHARVREAVTGGVAGVFGLEPASFDAAPWRGAAGAP
jgi:hypothetical protein